MQPGLFCEQALAQGCQSLQQREVPARRRETRIPTAGLDAAESSVARVVAAVWRLGPTLRKQDRARGGLDSLDPRSS